MVCHARRSPDIKIICNTFQVYAKLRKHSRTILYKIDKHTLKCMLINSCSSQTKFNSNSTQTQTFNTKHDHFYQKAKYL